MFRDTHHWHEDASRAGVERILDLPRSTSACTRRRDAHERTGCVTADPCDRLDGLCRAGLERGESVFTIDHDPREVWARLCDRPGVDHTWQSDPCPKGGLGGFECLCESVSGHEMG